MPTVYRIRFNNVEEQEIQCTLTDETGDLDIIDIQGAEDAVRIVSQDNDESKYSPIKAKKCVIKFLNSQSVNVRTFSIGEDNRWLCEVKINSLMVFVGHLEQGDIEEPFQYEQNQIVVLTATDGLGSLKTHRLEDIYNAWSGSGVGGCINNVNPIIEYIAASLGATGLSLTINVINNLREIDNPATDPITLGCIYAALYINIKTWEDQKAGQYLNCYDILEKILGHDCYLTQAKGQWWIIRVTELRQDFNMTKTIFDFDGTLLSAETLNYEKAIGLKDITGTPFGTPDATAFFSQDNTMLGLQRPVKSVTLNYKYENPIELLCNQSLLRGTFIADLPDQTDADGNTLTAKSFTADCWTYEKGAPPTTQDSVGYLVVTYHDGFEIDRYLHAEPTAVETFYFWSNCEVIPIGLSDTLSLSIPVRFGDDVAGAGYFLRTTAQLRLSADDGTFWSCHVSFPGVLAMEPGKFWAQAPDGSWANPLQEYLVWEDNADFTDFAAWNTLTYDIPPAPRSGQLQIVLVNADFASSRSKDFGAVTIGYSPYIAGGYNLFSSQTDTTTRDGEYLISIDDDVFISNAPRPLLRGALLKPQAGIFVIVGLFYEGQQYDETTGPDHLATYGELRVRAYHNQFRNGDEIYRATCQGLGEGVLDANGLDDHQDLIHRYFNRDIEPSTNNQAFQLVAQDVDLRNCEWAGTLIKNFDIAIGFVVDTYVFSYGSPGTVGGGGGGGGGGGLIPPGGGQRFGVAGEDDTATQNRTFTNTGQTFRIQNDNGVWTNLLLIDDGGVSISANDDTTDPSSQLDMSYSNFGIVQTEAANTQGRRFVMNTSEGIDLGEYISGVYTGINIAYLTGLLRFNAYGAGTLTTDASGNVTSVSDIRLKDIQGSYNHGIEAILQIVPIMYKWNKESKLDQQGTYIGFSAQNIQSALGDEAVGHDKNGYLSVQDRSIIATLVNAVKELREEIEILKKKCS